MIKILLAIFLILSLFSCYNNSDDDNTNNENTIAYYFGISNVLDPKSDEDKKFEIEIDGEKFNGIAPYQFKKVKKITTKKTHIKFKLNNNLETNVVYELRFGGFGIDSRYLSGGTFQDQLDTIITINKN